MLTKRNFKHLKTEIVVLSLILLLVCFSDGWGQDDCDFYYNFPEMEDSTKVIVGKDSLITKSNPYCVAPIIFLIQQYEQYKKECCSDTTWWLVSIYNTIYKIHSSPYKIVDISDDGNVYYLCIKPTIDGFIEFLKGKGRKTN